MSHRVKNQIKRLYTEVNSWYRLNKEKEAQCLSVLFSPGQIKTQNFWQGANNRATLASVLRLHVSGKKSFKVEGGDFFIDHLYAQYPEDWQEGEADVLVLFIYSVRPKGLVRMFTGDYRFTKKDSAAALEALRREFPGFMWGPWDLPQKNAGYSQGQGKKESPPPYLYLEA